MVDWGAQFRYNIQKVLHTICAVVCEGFENGLKLGEFSGGMGRFE